MSSVFERTSRSIAASLALPTRARVGLRRRGAAVLAGRARRSVRRPAPSQRTPRGRAEGAHEGPRQPGSAAGPGAEPSDASASAPNLPQVTPEDGHEHAPAETGFADVLVVDDDDDVRTSMAAILRGGGFSVVEAADGQSAFDQLGRTRVGAILLDLHMAPRDGVWLLEQLRDPPVVIVVSAFALYRESDMRRRFSEIITHFVQKPVAPIRLISLVRDSLESSAE